jgi:hypothetical protein
LCRAQIYGAISTMSISYDSHIDYDLRASLNFLRIPFDGCQLQHDQQYTASSLSQHFIPSLAKHQSEKMFTIDERMKRKLLLAESFSALDSYSKSFSFIHCIMGFIKRKTFSSTKIKMKKLCAHKNAFTLETKAMRGSRSHGEESC